LEKDGWIFAHNALRSEMKLMREALEAISKRNTGVNAWEIRAIRTASSAHLEHMKWHADNEDVNIMPELRKRFKFPERDNKILSDTLERLKRMVEVLQPSDSIRDLAFLAKEWTAYEAMMLPQLKEEDEVGFPLMRAYFSPDEYKPIVQKSMKGVSKVALGSVINAMGPEAFRNGLMKQEKIPSFFWYILFKGYYSYYVKVLPNNIDALKEGIDPATKKKNIWLNSSADVIVITLAFVLAAAAYVKYFPSSASSLLKILSRD